MIWLFPDPKEYEKTGFDNAYAEWLCRRPDTTNPHRIEGTIKLGMGECSREKSATLARYSSCVSIK